MARGEHSRGGWWGWERSVLALGGGENVVGVGEGSCGFEWWEREVVGLNGGRGKL